MKIASWNVNSVRIRAKMIQKLIEEQNPSFILLQETKCIDECFPHHLFPGYKACVFGQKSYNGIAILAKENINISEFNKIQICNNTDARCGYVVYNDICIINVYVPCGDIKNIEPKTHFLNNFASFIGGLEYKYIIAGGDYNVALTDEYADKIFQNGVLCLDEVRDGFQNILNSNMKDLSRTIEYTWWDYRMPNQGAKIDYILTKNINGNIKTLKEYRSIKLKDHDGKKDIEIKPSDHVPLILETND